MKFCYSFNLGLLLALIVIPLLTECFNCQQCIDRGYVCETVQGNFTVTVMSKGYNPVVTLPIGACNVIVTQTASSRNILALKDLQRDYILNGKWITNAPGEYAGAGATFQYDRLSGKCPSECIKAIGPLRSQVFVHLLFHERNPGVSYSYQIPIHLKNVSLSNTEFYSELLESPVEYQDIQNKNSNFNALRNDQDGHFPTIVPIPGNQVVHNRGPIFTSDFSHLRGRSDSKRPRTVKNDKKKLSNENVQKRRQSLTGVSYSRGQNEAIARIENTTVEETYNSIQTDTIVNKNNVKDSIVEFVSVLQKFSWRHVGNTDCSRPCGGGIQETIYDCVNTITLQTVDEVYCNESIRPEIRHNTCNTDACTPSWKTGQWSQCSATCGRGEQSRDVSCEQRISATDSWALPDVYCLSQKPEHTRKCYEENCYGWVTGEWSACSVNCGLGTRHRRVQCRANSGLVVNGNQCIQLKPTSEESCDMGPCMRRWYVSQWNKECSSECGNGTLIRNVRCATDYGQVLADDQCDVNTKPSAGKTCSQKIPCGGKWFIGPWSKCSRSCNEGTKMRLVFCLIKSTDQSWSLSNDENHCKLEDKPETTLTCFGPDCGDVWFTTEWSECSQTCDGGFRNRSVKCIRNNEGVSTQCDKRNKPAEREECNVQKCTPRTTPDSSISGCTDKYTNCAFVVQAKMCRYPYYQRKCCNSCSAVHAIYARSADLL